MKADFQLKNLHNAHHQKLDANPMDIEKRLILNILTERIIRIPVSFRVWIPRIPKIQRIPLYCRKREVKV